MYSFIIEEPSAAVLGWASVFASVATIVAVFAALFQLSADLKDRADKRKALLEAQIDDLNPAFQQKAAAEDAEAASGAEALDDTEAFDDTIVFDTRKQTTSLRLEGGRIVCLLLNKISNEEPKRQWSFSPVEAQNILESKDFRVDDTYKPLTGKFDLGRRKNWLYSKRLFAKEELEDTLERLLIDSAKNRKI